MRVKIIIYVRNAYKIRNKIPAVNKERLRHHDGQKPPKPTATAQYTNLAQKH